MCRTKCLADIRCSTGHFDSPLDIFLPENVRQPLFSVPDISSTLTTVGQNVQRWFNTLPDISKLCRTCPASPTYLIITATMLFMNDFSQEGNTHFIVSIGKLMKCMLYTCNTVLHHKRAYPHSGTSSPKYPIVVCSCMDAVVLK